jgi:hypothetical protein
MVLGSLHGFITHSLSHEAFAMHAWYIGCCSMLIIGAPPLHTVEQVNNAMTNVVINLIILSLRRTGKSRVRRFGYETCGSRIQTSNE